MKKQPERHSPTRPTLKERVLSAFDWTMCSFLVLAGSVGLASSFLTNPFLKSDAVIGAIVSLLAIAIGLERVSFFARTFDLAGRLSRSMDQQSQQMSELRERLLTFVEENPEKVLANFKQYLGDPYLSAVFDQMIRERTKRLIDSLRDGEIYIDDKATFTRFYINTLEHFASSGAKFTATSLASSRYFWNDVTQKAVADFTAKGSSMARVFIIREEDLGSAEVREILEAQVAAGVEVFLADYNTIPRDFRSTFVMVEQDMRIAWKVQVDVFNNVHDVLVTARRDKIEQLQRELSQLPRRRYESKAVG